MRIEEFAGLRIVRAALLLAALLALAMPVVAMAQGRAQVYILPPNEAAVTGQPVVVDIIAEGVSNLYGAELHLSFDPALVRLEDADPGQDGVQLTPGTLLSPDQGFVVANRADNQAGTAVFAVTLVNPAPPVDGNGVVARVAFVPLQPGALRLELENVKLVTRDLQTLDVSLSGLEVPVGGQAVAPAGLVGQTDGAVGSAAVTGEFPATGVPIWALVLVALAVVSIPLAGAWFVFTSETKGRPWAGTR